MPARIVINGKAYKGRTIDSIVRREFGQKAVFVANDSSGGRISIEGTSHTLAVDYAHEYKRTKPLSRQRRWDNACGKMRNAVDAAQEVYDEIEQDDDEDDENLSDEERDEKKSERQERLDAATAEFADGLSELQDLRDEYQEWEDNLPEQFQGGNSPVSEKIQEVLYLDLDTDITFDIDDNADEADQIVTDAESADLPLGFGRD